MEVRGGRVTNYNGQYDAYLYAVNKEIDDGEMEAGETDGGKNAERQRSAVAKSSEKKGASSQPKRTDRELRKLIAAAERTVAELEERKRQFNRQFLEATDPTESLRLHNELLAATAQLAEAEERWCRLQEELGEQE